MAKEIEGKPPLDLLSYEALARVAEVRAFGLNKYGGDTAPEVPDNQFLGAALRHIYKALDGQAIDEESGLSHVAHAAMDLMLVLNNRK
jgi:hypothetical protein